VIIDEGGGDCGERFALQEARSIDGDDGWGEFSQMIAADVGIDGRHAQHCHIGMKAGIEGVFA
jgi:hypothetical protein